MIASEKPPRAPTANSQKESNRRLDKTGAIQERRASSSDDELVELYRRSVREISVLLESALSTEKHASAKTQDGDSSAEILAEIKKLLALQGDSAEFPEAIIRERTRVNFFHLNITKSVGLRFVAMSLICQIFASVSLLMTLGVVEIWSWILLLLASCIMALAGLSPKVTNWLKVPGREVVKPKTGSEEKGDHHGEK